MSGSARLNAYDAEDISFEAFVMVLMAGMLSVVRCTRVLSLIPVSHPRLPTPQHHKYK